MAELQAVQVRLMGEPKAVNAVAAAMVKTGLLSVTGTAKNKDTEGIRVYAVAIPPAPIESLDYRQKIADKWQTGGNLTLSEAVTLKSMLRSEFHGQVDNRVLR